MGMLRTQTSTLPVHVMKDRVVRSLTEAQRVLAEAESLDQVKLVMDVADAQAVFATRQQLGEDVIRFAHAIKTRALTRLGELLKQIEKHKGGRPLKTPSRSVGVSAATLADLGVTHRTASIAQQLADLPPTTREQIARRETTLAKARRELKAVQIRQEVALPDAKYRVGLADPPWCYHDKADAGSVQAGGADRHYPTMTIAQLCALPMSSIFDDDAVLFLWVTSPLLFEALPVIPAWGFVYKASFVWDKVRHNMGHYNSVRHEFLLLCTRGSCTPDHVELFDSVQSIQRTTHSTKPPEFRRIIDTLYPYGKRIELFARERVDRWDAYGFEVEGVA